MPLRRASPLRLVKFCTKRFRGNVVGSVGAPYVRVGALFAANEDVAHMILSTVWAYMTAGASCLVSRRDQKLQGGHAMSTSALPTTLWSRRTGVTR